MKPIRFLFGAALLALAPAIPAEATILFAGGEDVDFVCTGTCTTTAVAGQFRSSFAREAYSVKDSTADPPANRFSTAAFAGVSSLWTHAQFISTAGALTSSGSQMLRVMDAAGNPTLIIRGTGTNNQVKISSRTSAGVFTDLVTCSSAFDATLSQIDLFIDYRASGSVTLYKNGTQTCTFSGDVTNGDGATTITGVQFAQVFSDINQSGVWSEVIVADIDTRAKALYRLTPNASGNTVAWSGSNPCTAILNNTSFNDGSFVSTGTDNLLEQCTTTNSIPAGTWNVDAVVTSGRLLRGASGPQNFAFSVRTGGSDFPSSDIGLTTGFANYQKHLGDQPEHVDQLDDRRPDGCRVQHWLEVAPVIPLTATGRRQLVRLRAAACRQRRAVALIEHDAVRGLSHAEQLQRFLRRFPSMPAVFAERVWREAARRAGERAQAAQRQIMHEVEPMGSA